MSLSVPMTMSIPVSPWVFQGNGSCLNGSPIGIQDAETLGMLITCPVHHEHVDAVLQGAAHLHQPTVYQQLRPGLDTSPGDADSGLSVRVCRQVDLDALQGRYGISQTTQFRRRCKALCQGQLRQGAAQGVTCMRFERGKFA